MLSSVSRVWLAGLAAGLVIGAGCGSSSPTPQSPASSDQVSGLEQRIARLEKRIAKLTGSGGQPGRRDRVQRKLERIDAQLAELDAKLREVEAKAETAARDPSPPALPPPPPPPPPRRRGRPDPDKSYAVPLSDAPIVGPKTAWVTIVVGYDFGPFVQRVQPTLDEILKRYDGDVQLAYKNFPIWPDRTGRAMLATCAAHRQGKFKAMFDAIYAEAYDKDRDFSEDNLNRIAKSAGLNVRKFKRDIDSQRCRKWVDTHQADLKRVGATGTPSFYINGRFLSGAQPIENFTPIIDAELEKAKKSGISKRRYYRQVVKTGVRKVDDGD